MQLLRRAEVDPRTAELEAIPARWESTLTDDVGVASS